MIKEGTITEIGKVEEIETPKGKFFKFQYTLSNDRDAFLIEYFTGEDKKKFMDQFLEEVKVDDLVKVQFTVGFNESKSGRKFIFMKHYRLFKNEQPF